MTTVVAHHVSPASDICSFRPGSHFGTRAAASERAAAGKFEGADLFLYSVELTFDASLEIYDEGGVHDLDYLIDAVRCASKMGRKSMNGHNVDRIRAAQVTDGDADAMKLLADILRETSGYDCLVYGNQTEDEGSRSYIVLWPERTRIVGMEPLSMPARGPGV